MPFTLRGPKGGLLVRRAKAARLVRILPKLVARFKKVSVTPAPPPVLSAREKVVEWARWGVQHEPQIHYSEGAVRSEWLTKHSGVLPLTTDCSGFVTACYRWSELPDPNGLGYARLGFTGTLLEHGKPVAEADVRPGDVVVYGPGTGVHTAVVVQAGPDPLTVSHGTEGGPEYVHVSRDNRQPVRYLTFLP
jgi:hypothetical protein